MNSIIEAQQDYMTCLGFERESETKFAGEWATQNGEVTTSKPDAFIKIIDKHTCIQHWPQLEMEEKLRNEQDPIAVNIRHEHLLSKIVLQPILKPYKIID